LKSVVADKEKQIVELDGRVKKLMATSTPRVSRP